MTNGELRAIQESYSKVHNSNSLILKDRDIWGATLVPEVRKALLDWTKHSKRGGIVIGGCALGVYTRPRTTTDADILYLDGEAALPVTVEKFKKTRAHAFTHKETGVEIETLTPEYLKLSSDVVDYVKAHVEKSGGIEIASKTSIILLKAQRLSHQDKADIFELFKTMQEFPADITPILTDKQLNTLKELWNESKEH